MAAKKSKKQIKTKTRKSRSGGLDMDFISMKTLSSLSVEKRINTILSKVKEGHMVVLDQALDADEEAKLVTATMKGIKGEFTGIEFCTLPSTNNTLYNFFAKIAEIVLKKAVAKPGLTFVGPSYRIEKIKKDPNAFYVSTKGK